MFLGNGKMKTKRINAGMRSRNVELFWKYQRAKQSGSAEAEKLRVELLKANDGLAITMASRFKPTCGEDLEDLVQLARMGLDKAIRRFDPSQETAFSSFAVPHVRGAIQHFLRDHWNGYKVPRRWVEFRDKVYSHQRRCEALGRSMSADEVAIKLLMKTHPNRARAKEKWEEIKQALHRKPSVQLEENLHQPVGFVVEEAWMGDETGEDKFGPLYQHLAQLPEPHHGCVVERFVGQLTDEAIANQQNLKVEQVRVLIEEGLEWLKHRMEGDLLEL